MIRLKERKKGLIRDINRIETESERLFAKTVLEIPGIEIRHEHIEVINDSKYRRPSFFSDFYLRDQSGKVGAIVEVTTGLLGSTDKRRQISRCGCNYKEDEETKGVCVRRNQIFHSNPDYPNPLSLIVIAKPAIYDESIIRKCVSRVVLGK